MPCAAATNTTGYRCPVRGCPKRNNRLFSLLGMAMHFIGEHEDQYIKRLKIKKHYKYGGRMNQVRR